MKQWAFIRKKSFAVFAVIILSAMTLIVVIASGMINPSPVLVRDVPLVMDADGDGYWSDSGFRGIVLDEELYVPVHWLQFAVLRNAYAYGDGKYLRFTEPDDASVTAMSDTRRGWTRSALSSGLASSDRHIVIALRKSVQVIDATVKKPVDTRSLIADGKMYLPFSSLSAIFGGSWQHDPNRFLIDWQMPDSGAAVASSSDTVASTADPIPSEVPQRISLPETKQTPLKVQTKENIRPESPIADVQQDVSVSSSVAIPESPGVTAPSNQEQRPNPTEEEINEQAVGQLLALQSECRANLSSAYSKAKAAKTDSDRDRYIAQGKSALGACDGKFESILSTLKSDLTRFGYDTEIVNTYRQLYNNIKSQQSAGVIN